MKRTKIFVLRIGRALGGFALARRLTSRGVRILCYHGTWRTDDGFSGDAMFMRSDTFQQRLQTIRRLGYPVVKLSDAVRALRGEGSIPACSVVITIDDGWYGSYADMLPALKEQAMPATLYCDSGSMQSREPVPHIMARWLRKAKVRSALPKSAELAFAAANDITATPSSRLAALERFTAEAEIDTAPYMAARAFDYMTPEELREAAEGGLDVQLHTHNHTLGDFSPGVVAAEVAANRAALAELLPPSSAPLEHFCYPSGLCSAQAAEALATNGVISATTTVQGIAWRGMNPYLLPRLQDGEQVSEVEFEAELSGFADWLRWFRPRRAR